MFLLDAAHDAPDEEVLSSFLEQFYARATSIPRQVLVPFRLPEGSDLEAFLSGRRGGPVHLLVPQRGERRELMALATRNAAETLAREQARWLADQGKTLAALEELAEALELPGPPFRIECYDISNVQGSDSVGSMVVFEEGKPRTGEYRRFKIRTVVGANDFASHQEVLRRRFRRARNGEEGEAEELRWAMPDLVIIDGGKGQVAAAKEVLDELGLHDLPLAGLAKEREELFLPGRSDAGRPAADVVGAVPRPAAARRGPPLRDHVPPRPALEAPDPLRVRRPAGRRPEAPAGAAPGLRLGEARPRGAGRADRGGARDRPVAGGPDQGVPGRLSRLARGGERDAASILAPRASRTHRARDGRYSARIGHFCPLAEHGTSRFVPRHRSCQSHSHAGRAGVSSRKRQ